MNSQSSLTRRQFLSTAAAATAAAALPGDFALGQSSVPSNAPVLDPDWAKAGIIATRNSPYAKLKSIPVQAVTITPGFWSRRRQTNVESSIPSMRQELVDHGRMDNFLRLEGKSTAPQRGPVYSDSDIYKWLEAVGFALQSGPLPELRGPSEEMIRQVVAAQEPSGYLNTYFVEARQSDRMLPKTQTTGHELYCIGHLLQGGIAWYRATGDPTLLNAGLRFVDNFLLPGYGPGATQGPIVAGHPEIEMSLIEAYRTTGNRRYLELAGYILQGDPRIPLQQRQIVYMFCGVPFTSRTKLEGHAVRAMYACCGATDYYLETGDPAYWKTLNHLWDDLAAHQLYVTGGVGARSDGEAFGNAYELPNETAYGESCAAIGNMMWNWRMLSASGDAKFTDVMERALYNGINSGMSLDGKLYCYRNPLAFDPSTGDKIRNPWYDTTCCPPNLERTFASLPGYFYSTSAEGVYVHFYDNSELNWQLQNGARLSIKQTTQYPWEGTVHLAVTPASPQEFTLFVRIPGWSKHNTVKVNGKPVADVTPGQYLPLKRSWSSGDAVELTFDMQPQAVHANLAVIDDRGRVAFQRGPIVYCMEQLDQAVAATDTQGFPRYTARIAETTTTRYQPQLLEGVVVLEHPGAWLPAESANLYQAGPPHLEAPRPTTLRLIPYYAWSNRQLSAMQVWIPYRQA
ncbi:MAG TPA: beta-L-arabinofuranosidase domain-containing protein [Acidobacteriaceae bacterium]|nr:beta-L-arabinofuranosidase domain-containing protein [Acidobacteriaceae bacterium]